MAALECRMPRLHGGPSPEVRSMPCPPCECTIRANADLFVRELVLPQLRSLKSDTTGLDDIVIPPRWVVEYDKRERWPVLRSGRAEFVFCHHDLVPHNLLLSTRTLEVLALVDIEECGYFPAEVQQWKCDRAGQFDLYEEMELVQKHIRLIGG
ncbi:hypothetical protein NKR19_g3601 [Coniochaeta hoffmannii]|uniref:Aminoglycoside phosphotransferase domain-containing protein n=1 Tax=Coniochaeta hoffmannii TaxID=91930 RepID=A0AA38RWP8_9PEZI|nr:hypothetical protein NKR19_g3601 [Coniochaeta hoffmannii]